MLAVNRRKETVALLEEKQSVTVTHLSERFQVTEETIRRDLEKLEAEGCLRRIHGGAVSIPDVGQELPFAVRNVAHIHEKRWIALEAVKLICDHDVIALDASSTSLQLAYLMQHKKNVTIVTNSLHVVNAVKDVSSVRVFCTGGMLRSPSLCFVGESAEEMLSNYVINKAFISTRGITLQNGLMEPNEQEARIKKVMIRLAKQVILLQDHSKYGQTAFFPIASIEQIDYLITNEGIPDEYVQRVKELGKTIIITQEDRVSAND